jgi:hypothetical protein
MNEKEYEYHWRPSLAIQTVFQIILLPFIDLFHQCGMPCCWVLDRTLFAKDDDEEYYEESNADDIQKDLEGDDIERQLKTVPTASSTMDGDDDDIDKDVYK